MSSVPDTRRAIDVQTRLLSTARLELVPMKSVAGQLQHLPAHAPLAVTCSPVKGLGATLELTSQLLDLGHDPVPHLSTRLVEDRAHVSRLASWIREHGLSEVFLVAGDASEPVGAYEGVLPFLRDLLDAGPGLVRIGVTAYPDGHALIERSVLSSALHAKQDLLAEAGIAGYATTQMCFDAALWRSWAESERKAGLLLPLHLGLPGAVDRTKLLTMGVRLGIGASLRFVKKNRGAISRLFSPTRYDPAKLLVPLSRHAESLGIDGLHVFTFNHVEATLAWRERQLARLA
ncbi:MAG: 5,10-methylenetetrahydrofolate reductase [Acidimicrobiia bacterium]